MLLLGLLAGLGTFFNYFAVTANYYPLLFAIVLQIILFLLATFSLIRYQGRRLRPSYDRAGYSIWTFSFAIILLSFIGNLAVLAVLLLNQFGYLSGF